MKRFAKLFASRPRPASRVKAPVNSRVNSRVHLPAIAEQMIMDKAHGLERAAEDAYRILKGGYNREHMTQKSLFASWNRFFRMLESEKSTPVYFSKTFNRLVDIAQYAFMSSSKNKNIRDLQLTAAVAMEKYMSQEFVGMDFVACVLSEMYSVYYFRDSSGFSGIGDAELQNRTAHIVEKLVIPKLARDIPRNNKATKMPYSQMTLQRLGDGIGMLNIEGKGQERIFETVCRRIPSMFAGYILGRFVSPGNKCRAIRIYRATCSRVTARNLDHNLWEDILTREAVKVLKCFLDGTTVSVGRKIEFHRFSPRSPQMGLESPLTWALSNRSGHNPERVNVIRAQLAMESRNRAGSTR